MTRQAVGGRFRVQQLGFVILKGAFILIIEKDSTRVHYVLADYGQVLLIFRTSILRAFKASES